VYRITSRRRLIVNCILTTSSLARKIRKDVYNAPEHMDTEIAKLEELWEDGQDHSIVRYVKTYQRVATETQLTRNTGRGVRLIASQECEEQSPTRSYMCR
jgi:hypothetical protein